jgi:hypothetical protein
MATFAGDSGFAAEIPRGERALPAWRARIARWLRALLGWVSGERQPAKKLLVAPKFSGDLFGLLEVARQTVAERVEHVNGMTCRETLAAGEALDALVGHAQAQISSTQTALAYATGVAGRGGMAELLARQSDSTTRYLDTLSGLLAGQDAAAQSSEKACERIAELGGAIEKVAAQAQFLSLNARIEAARLGERGTAMHVIAAEMEQLNQEVAAANRAIAGLVAALLGQLPAISSSANQLRDVSTEFSAELTRGLAEVRAGGAAFEGLVEETLSDASQRTESIVKRAQAALSHLQFQDACAQHLLSIDAILRDVRGRIEQAIDDDDGGELAKTSFEQIRSNPDRWAGDVSALRAADEGDAKNHAPGDVILL